jgi:hypothetical protein
MKYKVNFYDVVELLPSKDVPARLWGTRGVVVGRPEEAAMPIEYGVQLDADDGLVWQLGEEDLRSTGQTRPREDTYTDASIRVSVPSNAPD